MNCKHCGMAAHAEFCDDDCKVRWHENEIAKIQGAQRVLVQAAAIGNDYKLLRKRLADARACLKKEYREIMRNAFYRFKEKRMLSRCGRYELLWQLRNQPNMPESYENQQTSQGCVVFNKIRRVHWTPKLN